MQLHEVTTKWQDNMSFSSIVNNHEVILDAEDIVGGNDTGPRPKPMMLTALAGCTGMDVVSLLQKMRVPFTGLTIHVSGELTDEHPKIYKKVHIDYYLEGDNLDRDKVQKAVDLSQEKYCGVSAMFKAFAELTFEIHYK